MEVEYDDDYEAGELPVHMEGVIFYDRPAPMEGVFYFDITEDEDMQDVDDSRADDEDFMQGVQFI
ncbi:MAG: hypothetical protein ACRDL7_03485 [Gaiellaceae bacterium]